MRTLNPTPTPFCTQEPEPAKEPPKGRSTKSKAKASPKAKGKSAKSTATPDPVDDDVIIEYVAAPLDLGENFSELKDIVAAFNKRSDGTAATYGPIDDEKQSSGVKTEGDELGMEDAVKVEDAEGGDGSDMDSDDDDHDETELSNKQRKENNRVKIAQLKSQCAKPEVVEVWDVSATDPRLLVYLKSYRNTIPVPAHWSQKRAFLAGKRGLEKPPWQLPSFIEATGIQKLRDAYADKEDGKKLKQKSKDATTAKMGKIDIDYQVLHDAFFKFQQKPKMTQVGEVYYEGKEYETSHLFETKKPGFLSEETKEALGMTEDGPPPWLINMQRYGPPPSYPVLKIPGLSAPIPPGSQFGYHPGGWGKPPVDQFGRPIYGDVFGAGVVDIDESTPYDLKLVKNAPWGALEDAEEESDEESEEEKEEEESVEEEEAEETPAEEVQPAEPLDLRKRGGEDDGEAPPQLYRVLDVKEAQVGEGSLMGSAHTYVVPGANTGGAAVGAAPSASARGKKKQTTGATEITLNPEDLESGMDDAAMAARFAQETEKKRAQGAPEDFSDLVAENVRRTKRKAAEKKKESDAKKFKF